MDEKARREAEAMRRELDATQAKAQKLFVAQFAKDALLNAKADATRKVCDKLVALLPPDKRATFDVVAEIESLREQALEDFLLGFENADAGLAAAIQEYVETDPVMRKIWRRVQTRRDDAK